MQRRKFLKLGGLATALLAVPGAGWAAISVEDAAAGIITHEYHYLKLEPKGLEQFVADYLRTRPQNHYNRLKIKSCYYMKVKPEGSALVRHLVNEYIRSTDFFLNKMDESKAVKYLGLYNPWKRPCSVANPFSSVLYPPEYLV